MADRTPIRQKRAWPSALTGQGNGGHRGRCGEEWQCRTIGLSGLADGVLPLHYPGRTGLDWTLLLPLYIAALASLAVPGIVSRRKNGVPWWRFWARVISPAPAADMTGPGPAITLDARTSGLIGRIEKARFSTTRLSAGYDEEEVDISSTSSSRSSARAASRTKVSCAAPGSPRPGYARATSGRTSTASCMRSQEPLSSSYARSGGACRCSPRRSSRPDWRHDSKSGGRSGLSWQS
jgi:hypothetical protein